MVVSLMSWVNAAALVHGDGKEGDVFDEEADESLLVQREWRSHMQRRVKVKLRRGRGGHLIVWVVGRGARTCEEPKSRDFRGQSGPGLARRSPPYRLPPSPTRILLGFSSGLLKSV